MSMPKIRNSDHGPCDKIENMDNRNKTIVETYILVRRFDLTTSAMLTTTASTNPTQVVNPAITTRKKNSSPKKVPPGIMSNKLGIVKNNRPAPESGATSNANNEGKITSPEINAKNESNVITQIPAVTRLNHRRLR